MPMEEFWVSYNKISSNTFQWPDGSTNLTAFGNGQAFKAKDDEKCAVASLEIVSMTLMIFPRTCTEQEYGFCLSR